MQCKIWTYTKEAGLIAHT